MSDKFIRLPEVKERVGLSTSGLYGLIASGGFPRPCKAGRASVWSLQEIIAWQAQALARRDQNTDQRI